MTSGDSGGLVDMSIAIVSYNTRTLLLDCLKSVFESTDAIRFEVIVVDNNSQDATVPAVQMTYPKIDLIVNQENLGFAKAVNQGFAVSRGRYFLMLNSDTRIRPQTLDRMLACLDQEPTIGAVGCKQWTGDGLLYQSCYPFPSIRDHLTYAEVFRRWAPRLQGSLAARQVIDCSQSQDVDWINGACLLVRRELMKACGGLDEGYFMYFEDVDLCREIRRRGYRIRHLADADIVHLLGRSGTNDRARLNIIWEFSRIRYVEKHFSWLKRWIMKGWIAVGAMVRLIGAFGRSQSAATDISFDTYLSIVRRLWSGGRPTQADLAWSSQSKG
ncbi:MAG: glycosyltransferase family 2 protein [Nitrospira sp.]